MTQSDYTVRQLLAADGCFITQAADVPDSQRIVATRIILAETDDPANWKEISALEAGRIRAAYTLAADKTAPAE